MENQVQSPPDPWGVFNAEMGLVFDQLQAACQKFTDTIIDYYPESKKTYEVACKLMAIRNPGVHPNLWTMGGRRGLSQTELTPHVVVVSGTGAAVFRGPFQPAWALYAADATDALTATQGGAGIIT